MSSGRPADKARAEANLRAVLGCETTERMLDVARRVVAERDALRLRVVDLERALEVAWEARDAG